MSYFRNNQEQLKMLRLQLHKHNQYFSTGLPFDLTQKQTKKAKITEEEIKAKLRSDVVKQHWKLIPKARVAVSMHFHTSDDHIPALHNLVKFYLDLLNEILFKDDRQVGYLEASCWRSKDLPIDISKKDDLVLIRTERLTSYQQRFDEYFSLCQIDDFQEYLRTNTEDSHLIDNNELEVPKPISNELMKSIGLSEEKRQKILRLQRCEMQNHLLSLNKIERFDRPGSAKAHEQLVIDTMPVDLLPMTINIGDLPRKGESNLYKQRIQACIKTITSKVNILNRLNVPIEIDLQVMPRRGTTPEKDLDNIIRDIAPALQEELFDTGAYLYGFRAYVIQNHNEGMRPGQMRLKLMGVDTIGKFDDNVIEIMKAGKKWISSCY